MQGRTRDLTALQRVQRPRALRELAWVLVGMFAATMIALVVLPWQQNITGAGRVVAFDPFDRIQTLAAPVSGRVEEAWVIEGSRVKAGDRILKIVDNDPSILRRLEEQRSALQAQLDASEQKVEVFDSQLDALERARSLALEAARNQVEVAKAAVESARFGLEAAQANKDQARLNFERHRELVQEGLASELEFEVTERVYKEARARVSQAEQALQAQVNDLAGAKAQREQIGTSERARIESARTGRQSAQSEAASNRERLTALDTRIAQQSTQLITAPRRGTIYRLFASPGAELVNAGDPLVQLIPDAQSRAVELWVDGNDVPLISEGRPVRLQFEGWPAAQFSGWPSVAIGTFGGKVKLVDPTDDGKGHFRILVVPDDRDDEPEWPDAQYLRQGARAKGFVLLDRVSLGYELWRLANGFPPTVAMQAEPGRVPGDGA